MARDVALANYPTRCSLGERRDSRVLLARRSAVLDVAVRPVPVRACWEEPHGQCQVVKPGVFGGDCPSIKGMLYLFVKHAHYVIGDGQGSR